MTGRPSWFDTAVAMALAAGAAAFVALLAGFGSGLITDDPDESASVYAAGRPTGAAFAITRVEFGGDGLVEITNVGDEAGTMDGWFLCQRPSYHALPTATLDAGESLTIGAADASIGALDAADGEMGLYSSGAFGDAGAIVSYVEWGSAGHGRASVAVDAGIWPADAFVPAGGDRITADGAASSPDGWSS